VQITEDAALFFILSQAAQKQERSYLGDSYVMHSLTTGEPKLPALNMLFLKLNR